MVVTTTSTIPEISITLVGETNNSSLTLSSSYLSESPVFVTTTSTTTTTTSTTRLVVPPRPSDGPSRRTLVQRGLRLGSFRLNCTESQPTVVSSTKRTFNWSTQGSTPMTTSTSTRRGHSRARSLNSLADLNETLKLNVVQPFNNGGYIPKHGQRTPSIDLSILGFNSSSSSSNASHHFASAL
jgi:hypothetical protein